MRTGATTPAPRRGFSRAYRFLTGGDGHAGPGVTAGTSSRASIRIVLGRALLAVLFLVIPVFNPALIHAGDERFYLGGVVVLLAALLMLPSVLSGRYDWMLVALLFGGLYVLEVALLRGDLALGLMGNAYRPLHAVLTFCACAVFLLGTDRHLWTRLFLVGGLIGAGLALLNTLFPAFDPFALSRPDIGYESLFLESQRQSGAFVYPGNFGPYCAYVAVVALVMLERTRTPFVSANLYTATFVVAVLGLLTSGSRGAATGLLVGTAVVLWRTPRYRVPVIAAVAGAVALVAVGLFLAGNLGEIVRSRLLLADFSFQERLRSWSIAWEGLKESVLFGGGIIPNTVDNLVIYYLGVGGVVGLAVVAAMYWTSMLRPVRFRDWAGLPVLVAVVGVGLTQESLGTPLTSWAIAAGVFLLVSPGREREILAPEPRGSILSPARRTTAVAVAGLLVVAGTAAGALLAGRLPSAPTAQQQALAPMLTAAEVVDLERPRDAAPFTEVAVATEAEAEGDDVPLWLATREGSTVRAERYSLHAGADESTADRVLTGELEEGPGRLTFSVARWPADAVTPSLVAVEVRPRRILVDTLAPESGTSFERRGVATLAPVAAPVHRDAAVATWSGEVPDLFVVESGVGRPLRVTVFSGESGFRERVLTARLPEVVPDAKMTARVAHVGGGDRPDVVLTTPSGGTGDPEIHVLSGESDLQEFSLQIRLALEGDDPQVYEFATGVLGGEPALYAVSSDGERTTAEVLPLLYLPVGAR